MNGEVVRPLGMIERACSIRHDLGHYPCASITARVSFDAPQTAQKTRWATKRALYDTVLSQPIMCCGIIGEHTSNPVFVRLGSIDIPSCIEFHVHGKQYFQDSSEGSRVLGDILQSQHETCFTDIHQRPGWRVLVMLPQDESSISQIDILFAWHHGFFDGLSGVNFHKGLLRAMNRSLSSIETDEDFLLKVPRTLDIYPPIEKATHFPVTWKYYLQQCWNYYVPQWISELLPRGSGSAPVPVWAGNRTQLSEKRSYEMRLRVVSVGANDLASLLAKARQNKVSLTCLFHGAMATALAIHVPEARSFLTLTPLSLRNYTGNDKNEAMCNEFDDLWCTYDQSVLSAARLLRDRSNKDLSPVWDAGKVFKKTMAEHRAQIPWDLELAFADGWFDVRALHLAQLGKERGITFEMSNIGSIPSSPAGEKIGPQQCRISQFVWAQSAMVTGPLFTVGSATVEGGPLTFTYSWQKGATDDSLADLVITTFHELLDRVMEK